MTEQLFHCMATKDFRELARAISIRRFDRARRSEHLACLEIEKLEAGSTVQPLEQVSSLGGIATIRRFMLVALGLAVIVAPIHDEAASKRIHVTAKLVEQTVTGDPRNPTLGDRIIYNVEFDDSGTKVGVGAGVCTIVATQETSPDTLAQCLLSAVFDQGQIILGARPRCPNLVSWAISAFLAAQTTSGKPAVRQHSLFYLMETSTAS